MNPKYFATAVCLACLPAAAIPAFAAQSTANLGVQAVVADTCLLAAGTGMSFASISTSQDTNETTQGLITVTCTGSHDSVSVTLGGGNNVTNSTRHMKSVSGALMPYQVYDSSGRTNQVGINDAVYSGPVTALSPKTIQVYGKIPAGSYTAGTYDDTLLVTLNYGTPPSN